MSSASHGGSDADDECSAEEVEEGKLEVRSEEIEEDDY